MKPSENMKYLQFTFTFEPATQPVADVLAAVLGEAGFDSFANDEQQPSPLQAYVPAAAFSQPALDSALAQFPMPGVSLHYTFAEAEDKNWNEEWEKNYFQPLVVDGRCVVHSTFHQNVPPAEYEIVIDPRMSFGTGHHATTSQMISEILRHDMQGSRVLDMGCGTSILAILARMKGAAACLAVDNDEWCVRNSMETLPSTELTASACGWAMLRRSAARARLTIFWPTLTATSCWLTWRLTMPAWPRAAVCS